MTKHGKKEKVLQSMRNVLSDRRMPNEVQTAIGMHDEQLVVEMFILNHWRIDNVRSLRKKIAEYLKAGGGQRCVYGNPNCASELILDRW